MMACPVEAKNNQSRVRVTIKCSVCRAETVLAIIANLAVTFTLMNWWGRSDGFNQSPSMLTSIYIYQCTKYIHFKILKILKLGQQVTKPLQVTCLKCESPCSFERSEITNNKYINVKIEQNSSLIRSKHYLAVAYV